MRGVYDDNIFISHTNKVSDYYFAIEPEITIGVGDIEGRHGGYLRLDYMPSAILFVDHSDQDAFNQLIRLEGGYNSGRLTLSLSEDIALLESANLNSFYDTTGLWANTDASAPTRVNIFYTRLRANYELTGKLSLQGEFDSRSTSIPVRLVTTLFLPAFTFITIGCQRYRWVLAAHSGMIGWMLQVLTRLSSR